jgi:putative resolvase
MGTFETAEKIRGTFGVSTYSLRKWAEEGKIGCVRMPGGKRLYRLQDITNLFRMPERARQNICYTRVSSNKQRADLDRQVEQMKREYPSHIVVSDIGSGLNWKRPGLLHLLDLVCKNEVAEVVVTDKDRVCRFGYELVEWLFNRHNTKIIVCNTTESNDGTRELADDLLAITNYFVAKNNGRRAARNRRKRKMDELDQKIQNQI